MANRPAMALGLREGDRVQLVRWTRSSSVRAGLAQRARIVLAAADGESNTAIAGRVGVSRPTVIMWRNRYAAQGIAGLADQARSGRPQVLDHRVIVAETLKAPAEEVRGDALVVAAAGPAREDRRRDRRVGRGASTGWRRGGSRRSRSPPTPSS